MMVDRIYARGRTLRKSKGEEDESHMTPTKRGEDLTGDPEQPQTRLSPPSTSFLLTTTISRFLSPRRCIFYEQLKTH
jgi:hypothetical protein